MSFVLFGERPYVWYCNLVLMLCYAVGELGHFLLGATSRAMAQSIHFGDEGCLAMNDTYLATCSNFSTNEHECSNITADGTNVCRWDYTGSGVEYQLLAGPFFVAIFTVMGVVLGALGDRYSRVKILSVCVFICSATVLFTGFSSQYWQLALLRLVFGGAEAGFSPLSASIIADIFKDTSRGLAMSVFNWGIYFGFGSAFAVGNLVTEADIYGEGWRWAYYMSGIPGFILVLFVITSVREPMRKNVTIASVDTDNEHIEKTHVLSLFHKVLMAVKILGSRLSLIALLIGACVRHSASFCFAYNAQLYFSEYYPQTNLGLWMALSSIVGGSIGIASGGLISDLVVKRYGIYTRLSVLAVSQTLASPLAFGVLYIEPPYCFISLIGAYLFAEMWFGILFAVLVELFPTAVRSTSMATFFFVINNVAGLILLVVPSLKHSMGTRQTLTLVYPGFYLISATFFILAQFLLKREFQITQRSEDGGEEAKPMSEKPDSM